jgi:hypothetical protein
MGLIALFYQGIEESIAQNFDWALADILHFLA